MRPHALLVSLAAIIALALGGCANTPTEGVSPGDGPAASEPETPPGEGEGTPTDEPTDEPTRKQTDTANFKEKYTYEDGVEVEVIKIVHGKVSRADAEYSEPEAKAGDDYVILTVRVKNSSKAKLDAYSDWTLTYGADGNRAETVYLSSKESGDHEISGKILPGRSKTAAETFAIPGKYQNDPVLEFTFDFEHEAAIFTGSLK